MLAQKMPATCTVLITKRLPGTVAMVVTWRTCFGISLAKCHISQTPERLLLPKCPG